MPQCSQHASESKIKGNECPPTDLKSLPSYLSVLELGYDSDMIENVIRNLMRQGRMILNFILTDNYNRLLNERKRNYERGKLLQFEKK